ncbi:universal stress protein [Streptomyces acidiscabies]|uniref:universal stress protein n=1 Tax=Streptomyces acidiscabies TaxID=42234 RepID=UPI00073E844E|nr:universal stress protein [Streptomyces acidiscabies]GAQ50304.1 universal stress protein/MT2698 [Streptomyces acidiscabies]
MTRQNVVVGVDGSPGAVRALDRAAEEAVRRGTALRVVYAVRDRDEAGPVLASAVTRTRLRWPGLPVVADAVVGGAVEVLARESGGADLTVVGTRGLGPVAGLLAGSVSLRLAARAHGPLLVVRDDRPRDPASGGRAVVLGLRGDADDEAAVYAFQEAERRQAPLRVLHAMAHHRVAPEMPSPIPATSPGQRRRAQDERAERAVPRFGVARLREQHPHVPVEIRAVDTDPAHALLEAGREAAVVVIGAHRHSGPVLHTLLSRSHCPVVLVPTGE